VFTNLDEPCQYCQIRQIECVKTSMLREIPNTNPRVLEIARPLTADMEEQDLLKYAYSDDIPKNVTTVFIKKAASLLGPDIPYPAIRHACLAIAVRFLMPIDALVRSRIHELKAIEALSRTITNPSSIRDADVFAALLLAQFSIMDNRPGRDIVAHLNGCISLLDSLSKYSNDSISNSILQHFDFLVFDIADYVEPLTALRWMSSIDRLAFGGQHVFRRRVEFFRHAPGLFSAENSAVVHTLSFLLRSSVAIIRHVGLASIPLVNADDWLPYAIEDIKRQLDDAEFLQNLDQFSQPDKIGRDVDDLFPLQCLTCIRILRTIFESPTIREGIDSPCQHTLRKLSSHIIVLLQNLTESWPLYLKPRTYLTWISW